MNGLGDMMKQRQGMQAQVQENMEKMEKELNELSIDGSAGAGLVTVTMNGRHDVKKVNIDASLLSEDKEMLEDLLAAAVNDCVRKVDEQKQAKMSGLAGGFQMPPGFKMPF